MNAHDYTIESALAHMREAHDNAHHETPDEAELRRLAEAATPGPWSLTDGDPAMSGQHWTIRRQGVPGIRISGFTYGFNGDAAYIAAANPAAVLGLLDRLAHMTEARDNARAEVERLAGQVAGVRDAMEDVSNLDGWVGNYVRTSTIRRILDGGE